MTRATSPACWRNLPASPPARSRRARRRRRESARRTRRAGACRGSGERQPWDRPRSGSSSPRSTSIRRRSRSSTTRWTSTSTVSKPPGRRSSPTPRVFALIQAPASTLSLILNPAPPREGELNPFAIKTIRQAMQFLVDRQFIAGDIYGGRAVPMISHVSPLDYDELTVFETIARSSIRLRPGIRQQR